MIRVINENNKLIMPFDLSKPGRQTEEFLTAKVGNVSGHDYQKYEKGKDSQVVWMTCDQYIDKCINDIFDSTYEATVTNAVAQDKVKEYAQAMRDGSIFPVPYLNYVTNNQEGRHRLFAFKMINGPDAKAPVLVIKPTEDVSDEEIEDYCKRRWGSYWEDFFDTLKDRYNKSNEDENNEEDLEVDDSEDIDDIDDLDNISDEDDLDNTLQYLSDKSGYSVEEISDDFGLFTRLLRKYL